MNLPTLQLLVTLALTWHTHAAPAAAVGVWDASAATKTSNVVVAGQVDRLMGQFTSVPPAVASPTAAPASRPSPLIIEGYDFTIYPDLDIPPPINETWNAMYNVQQINAMNIPTKPPLNSISEPACPAVNNTGDWGCYNVTRPVDAVACPLHNQWALTYDDGPSPYTPALLDALLELNLTVTLCVIGSRVMSNPSILRRAYDEGHQICSHTWSHHFLTSQTSEQIISEFEWTNRIIEHVTGARPAFARPPFGDMDDRVRQVFTNMNMRPLLWNRDTFDWNLANPNSLFDPRWVVGNFTLWVETANFMPDNGFMSLEHDLYPASAAQTVPSLHIVHNAGYQIMPISECLNVPRYISVVSVDVPNVAPNPSIVSNGNQELPENPKAMSAALNEKSAARIIIQAIFGCAVTAAVAMLL